MEAEAVLSDENLLAGIAAGHPAALEQLREAVLAMSDRQRAIIALSLAVTIKHLMSTCSTCKRAAERLEYELAPHAERKTKVWDHV